MDLNNRCATQFTEDTHKRVNYTYGLVLGVGEFRTEQNYFLEKQRSHARSLHGYGTVAGLLVGVRDTDNGPEVRVSPGLAIDPLGREICVPEPQCALLNNWLLARQQAGDVAPTGHVTAYVTLCYRECETDKVPVPVGPCHSLDKSSVASRIQEAFELRLTETPPPQVEEETLKRLIDILAHVGVGVGPAALTTADPLLDEVRALVPGQASASPTDYLLDPQHAAKIIQTVLRVFITEVRPTLVPDGGGCLAGPADASCLLLAQLDFEIHQVAEVPQVNGNVDVNQDNRPLLLQTRALQEWVALLPNAFPAASAGSPSIGPVAAGFVQGDNTNIGLVFNNLHVVNVNMGEIVIGFDGYQPPNSSFQYVVKAQVTAVNPPEPSLRFLEFRPEGIALSLTRGDVDIVTSAEINDMRFMIEVDRIQ